MTPKTEQPFTFPTEGKTQQGDEFYSRGDRNWAPLYPGIPVKEIPPQPIRRPYTPSLPRWRSLAEVKPTKEDGGADRKILYKRTSGEIQAWHWSAWNVVDFTHWLPLRELLALPGLDGEACNPQRAPERDTFVFVKCPECSLQFLTGAQMRMHRELDHKPEPPQPEVPECYRELREDEKDGKWVVGGKMWSGHHRGWIYNLTDGMGVYAKQPLRIIIPVGPTESPGFSESQSFAYEGDDDKTCCLCGQRESDHQNGTLNCPIAPTEPHEWVPLGPEDVPPGSVVRHSDQPLIAFWSVSKVHKIGFELTTGAEWKYLRIMGGLHEISRDFGKSWHPCRKPAAPQPASEPDAELRREFEKWAQLRGFSLRRESGCAEYYFSGIENAWEAFRAGRRRAL